MIVPRPLVHSSSIGALKIAERDNKVTGIRGDIECVRFMGSVFNASLIVDLYMFTKSRITGISWLLPFVYRYLVLYVRL